MTTTVKIWIKSNNYYNLQQICDILAKISHICNPIE